LMLTKTSLANLSGSVMCKYDGRRADVTPCLALAVQVK
jgi:hypothetical protein